MKTKLLTLIICMGAFVAIAQTTNVPDINFENYLEANSMGNGIDGDHLVNTANIKAVTFLDLSNKNIADLTGIEDFVGLVTFGCDNNLLTTLDVSNNVELLEFACDYNQLTSLILNDGARVVGCGNNQLTSLIVPSGVANLQCNNNNITSLNLSNTTELSKLNVSNNKLTFLDFRNGENGQISSSYVYNMGDEYDFDATNNPNLTCIFVDDAAFSTTNWKKVDATSCFVADETACTTLAVNKYDFVGFKILPNPIATNINISIQEEANYVLLDINGRILKKGKLTIGVNTIKASELSNGIYIVKVYNKTKSSTKKIIKQ